MSYKMKHYIKVGDICNVSSSKRIYASEYVNQGVPFLRSKEVIEKAMNQEVTDSLFISNERFIEIKNKYGVPKRGDILLASIGANMGISYYINSDEEFYFKDGNVTWFSNFNEQLIDSKYLYCCLNDPKIKAIMLNRAIGSAQKALTIESLRNLEIPIISLNEQRKISKFIFNIDEKIKNNIAMNQTLEEMAQTLFKRWFVDFEFPNEEGQPYKSSGGEMIESELGMIPKGWSIGVFRDYIVDILGGDWGKEEATGNYNKAVYCLRGADIPEIRIGRKGKMPRRYILEKNYLKKKLTNGDLVVEISGGSPTQSTGRITYISKALLEKYDLDIVSTNFCRAITLKDIYSTEFYYYYWNYLYNNDVFFQYENGTTGIKNLAINSFLDKFNIVQPPKELIKIFHNKINTILLLLQANGEENEKLAHVRDTLLPKLMSGEIRVSDLC